jgi:hypothetical protein
MKINFSALNENLSYQRGAITNLHYFSKVLDEATVKLLLYHLNELENFNNEMISVHGEVIDVDPLGNIKEITKKEYYNF